jgi:BirA family biotin operon repressor/biotin-[acetyl-CoA-carboxylase] ligase
MQVDTSLAEQLLAELKRVPGTVSGGEVSRALGVTRAALWKQVQRLRRLGYEIEATPRVGYRLVRSPDVPYSWELRDGLGTERFGRTAYYVDAVGSTQDEVRRLADEGAPEGTLVVAERLGAARGRLGRSYVTPPGGLWFSLLLRPHRSPEAVIALSLLAAVGVHQGIEDATGLRPMVRWPNDLLADGRKLVGILIEMDSEQDVLRHAIAGIGINVNVRQRDFPKDLRPIATSLREVLGQEVPRVALLQRILERMEALYDTYLERGPRPVLDAWRALPTLLGQRVTVEELRERWEGVAVELDNEGALLVRQDGGAVRRVLAGDVRIVTGKARP